MAKKEPNKPDDMKTVPANETQAEEKAAPGNEPLEAGSEAPAPELTAEETAALAHEGQAALQDIGEEQLESPTTFDIPAPGDVVVSFDKINELANERKAAGLEAAPETKTQEAPAEKEAPAPEDKAPEKKAARKGRPTADKPDKEPKPEKAPIAEKSAKAPKAAKTKQAAGIGGAGGSVSTKATEKTQQETPPPAPVPEKPPEPREAPRSNEQEQIVYLNLSELYAFKDHPFQVKKDDEMLAMVESVKDKGVTQPAIVRPREDGGYEIVSGHRRQMASELAGFTNMPCVVRNLTDDEAITQMVEDNTNQREEILPSEKAKALKMQLEAIKRQGTRNGNGQRSNEIVAERNKMTVKTVQRYIKLNDLVSDLMKLADDKKIGFTPAVECAFIKPKNQRYIAIAVEGQSASPTFSQAKRMRELDQKGLLNPDMIDGIMLEEKKEVDKVILSSQELGQYFGKDKTPREMKDQIMTLLEEWKGQQKDIAKPEKKNEQEK